VPALSGPSTTRAADRGADVRGYAVKQRPNILFVTSHWPARAYCGGQQRVLNIAKLLSRIGQVRFALVESWDTDEETIRQARREFDIRVTVRAFPRPRGNQMDQVLHRLRHEIEPAYLGTSPYTISARDRQVLLNERARHDLTWIHTVTTANLAGVVSWPCSVLDTDDLLSRVYRRLAQSGGNAARRLADLRMAWLWRKRERLFTERFDFLTTCSEDDRQYLGAGGRTYVIPNGFLPQAERPRLSAKLTRLGFIGSFPFGPNEEGLKWFIRDSWPLIKRELPDAQLRLVGRNSNGYLTQLGPDIVGLGWIEDPGDEIATWSASIVPTIFGGGTRVKVAEAFARKCPVVATAGGAFGYDVHNGEELLLADTAEDFALACIRLLKNPQLGDALSERAHQRFLENWTWESFEPTVKRVVEQCLQKRPQVICQAPKRAMRSAIN
jgi:glycosyltransferase involved in cell wall biosynthesis